MEGWAFLTYLANLKFFFSFLLAILQNPRTNPSHRFYTLVFIFSVFFFFPLLFFFFFFFPFSLLVGCFIGGMAASRCAARSTTRCMARFLALASRVRSNRAASRDSSDQLPFQWGSLLHCTATPEPHSTNDDDESLDRDIPRAAVWPPLPVSRTDHL